MEDKKTYPPANVAISTEEYRDLIETATAAKNDADHYRNDYWSERARADKLQKELDTVTSEKAALKNYIDGLPKSFFGSVIRKIKEAVHC